MDDLDDDIHIVEAEQCIKDNNCRDCAIYLREQYKLRGIRRMVYVRWWYASKSGKYVDFEYDLTNWTFGLAFEAACAEIRVGPFALYIWRVEYVTEHYDMDRPAYVELIHNNYGANSTERFSAEVSLVE